MIGGLIAQSPVEDQAREAGATAAPASSAPSAVHAPAASTSSWAPNGRLPFVKVGLKRIVEKAAS